MLRLLSSTARNSQRSAEQPALEAQMKHALALEADRYRHEYELRREQLHNDDALQRSNSDNDAKLLQQQLDFQKSNLEDRERRVSAREREPEQVKRAYARDREALDTNWDDLQETAQERIAKLQKQGNTLEAERVQLEVEKKLVVDQKAYNESKAALLEKERNELDEAKIGLEVEKATIAAERKKSDEVCQALEERNFRTPFSASRKVLPQRDTPIRKKPLNPKMRL